MYLNDLKVAPSNKYTIKHEENKTGGAVTRRGDPQRFQEISFPARRAGAGLAPRTRRTSVLEECCPSPTGC